MNSVSELLDRLAEIGATHQTGRPPPHFARRLKARASGSGQAPSPSES
jgi:hypothetical protein